MGDNAIREYEWTGDKAQKRKLNCSLCSLGESREGEKVCGKKGRTESGWHSDMVEWLKWLLTIEVFNE